jgi:hypothetical protein
MMARDDGLVNSVGFPWGRLLALVAVAVPTSGVALAFSGLLIGELFPRSDVTVEGERIFQLGVGLLAVVLGAVAIYLWQTFWRDVRVWRGNRSDRRRQV